jgi:hypothetical protein
MQKTEAQLREEALRLAAESGADPRTARRWLEGEAVKGITDQALRTAAELLNIEGPKVKP